MVALSAAADDVSVLWSGVPNQFMATGLSADNNYVCGTSSIWNVKSGETVMAEDPNVFLSDVSNTGVAVGNAGDYAISMNANGETTYIEGMDFVNYSTALGISADGSIITGSRFDADYHQEACYWENGVHHTLPLPEVYEDMPDDIEVYGVSACGISEDGNVIIGNIITGTASEAVVMWTRNESGDYEFHPLYAGFMEFGWEEVKPYIHMSAQNVSTNGKWISLVLQLNSWEDFSYYAGRYNTETGEVECGGKISAYTEGDYYATGISDNGTTVGFIEQQEMTIYGRQSFVWKVSSENTELLSNYCEGNTEIENLEKGESLVYTGISGDGEHIIGYSMKNGIEDMDSFMINLNGDLSGINSVVTESKGGVDGIYNLQGSRVTGEPTPGIYIVIENGKSKKVMVK